MTNERIFIELKEAISETLVLLEVQAEYREALIQSRRAEAQLRKTDITPRPRNRNRSYLRRSVALNSLLHA